MRVRDKLTDGLPAPTPAEAKIVQLLLADYPLSGLGTAAQIAKRAGVSDPTVARLVAKLGYASFADFQAELLAELEARLHSPLLMMEARRVPAGDDHVARAYIRSATRRMADFSDKVTPAIFDQVEELVMEAPGRVYLLGGRFSRHLAGMLAGYLGQFREGVADLGLCSSETFDRLVDMGRRDVLIVFDYRRYQSDVVRFSEQAAERGVRLVLFTDPWLSPVAAGALHVLVAPVEVESPYDTFLPPLAQVEALCTLIVARRQERIEKRVVEFENAREANGVTMSGATMSGAATKDRNS
ncbi:DNA-binding MurR/RpiR family transcriptional regulator [Angulomicrobium tetraedrale]|uniref:DNA-binding MurR/RpiR family transcriptional regulator n=1 Tax=Ancylobacter tetraedralis TaxID=217068 RepID=A0A839Z8Z5_9HYPH|nr:MurR/RpiR family transcriptional regulator [Ancylobacter tetraedralis]MBB3771406.1 DNA-binding MurR/RpiR family transcriptional regulator [Ancylobacter tetraedralis]